MNDWLRALLRPTPDDDDTPDDPPPDFDGGARTSLPAPPPSMSTIIRRAYHGDHLAGTDDKPTSNDPA